MSCRCQYREGWGIYAYCPECVAEKEDAVMSAPLFTPGPWQTAPNFPNGMTAIIDSDGRTKPYSLIAKAENEDNARLIAAAPTLLEALEEWLEAVGPTAVMRARQKAVAAINAATGGQQ
jgi:hypothetical protein